MQPGPPPNNEYLVRLPSAANMESEESQFATLVMRHLFQARGIDMSGYSPSFVMRSIKKRLGRSGASDYAGYLRLLKRSEDETNALLGTLSVNVTEFFRDRGAFEGFTRSVVKPLLQSKIEGGGIARFWSAGCATGQETYTMAICIAEVIKGLDSTRLPMVTILGTDISTSALAKAKSGVYTKDEVKGLPDNYLLEYFKRTPQGYEATPALRKGMRFSRENLLEEPQSKYFDAIICRNVMIYFSREMHDKVATNLYHALMRGGYLMLGKTETLLGAPREAFDVMDLENRILRKKA